MYLPYIYIKYKKYLSLCKSNKCWIWNGCRNSQGYGTIKVEGKATKAHRLFYSSIVGKLDDNLHLHHVCGVRNCVNPRHLKPLSPQEHSNYHSYALGGMASNLGHHAIKAPVCRNGHTMSGRNVRTYYNYKKGVIQRRCRACELAARRRRRELVRCDKGQYQQRTNGFREV